MKWENIKNEKASEFKRFTGFKRETFDEMVRQVNNHLKKRDCPVTHCRPAKLSVEQQILATIMYWKEYSSIYDEEKLNKYHFDDNAFRKERDKIDKHNKQARVECKKKWHEEQRQRQLQNKIPDRYLSIDLNPKYIGYTIFDGNPESGIKNIIKKEVVNLTQHSTKLRLSSSDPIQKYQNNKRTYEICEAWKYIFDLANHYGVAVLVKEDLGFKKKINDSSSEANRQTKNIWHRSLTERLISKYTNTLGIELREVNPSYTSFIGNMQHDYFDPLNAALEIGRRGIYKYISNEKQQELKNNLQQNNKINLHIGFYPSVGTTDLDAMYRKGLDVSKKPVSTWVKLYQMCKTSKLRYRGRDNHSSEKSLRSHKSRTTLFGYV